MKSNKPLLVSFIVPIYNAECYLNRCIDSLLSQSDLGIEIICINDGSSDRSSQIIDAYHELYPDIIHVYNQENSGIAAARNKGIELAKGDYIAFVDNDDWLDSDWLDNLSRRLNDVDAVVDIICSGYRRPDGSGKIVTECRLSEKGDWSPYLIGAPWAKLYRTDFIRNNKLSFFDTNVGEDLPFVIPAVTLAERCVVTDYCGYNWFYNTESVSNTVHKHSQGLQFEKTLNQLASSLRRDGGHLDPFAERYLIRLVSWFLFYTRKGDGIKRTVLNTNYYIKWLTANVPSWKACPIASPFLPSGDDAFSRVEVWLLAKHPALFKLAIVLYAKER